VSIRGLFSEYLPRREQEPMRVTDPRQQTMLTNQMLTPVMEKPVKPSQEVPVFPSVGGIGGGVVPTAEETTDSFEEYLSTLTTDDLDNLDLSGLNLGDINIPSYEEIKAALTGGSVAPTTLEGLAQLYQQQVSLLQNVDTLENVDIDDRPYWYNTTVSGVLGQPSQYSGAEFRAATGLPDSFSIYDSGQGLTEENTQRAIALLSESASPLEAVSQYYGIDLQAANNPNSNYNNASKYGTDSGKLSEFQSIVEPILQQVIPYLQLTKGLRYDDALEYAYKNDPMIAALYNQYGVNLFRQTDDGSTYFFDPISGTESRTIEVKDSSFRDVGLALTIAAASAILGPAIGKALGGTPLANATGKALAAGFKTVASGGDFNDVLKSMVTAGVVDYGLSQLAENIDLQKTLNEFGENFGIGSEISLSGEYTTLADGTRVLTETIGTQGNLGDLLAGVADAIQNPSSWTPSSIEEANIIWNLAGEAVTTGGSLVGEGGLTVGTFYDLLKTAYGVYKDSNQPPPKLPNDFTITFDPNTNDPIIIDKDGNAVVGIPSAEDERKDKDDGGGGGGGGEAAKDAEAAKDSETAKDAESAKDAERSKDSENAKDAEAEKNKDAKKPEREDKESGGMSEAQKDQAAEKANKEMQAEEERENKEAEAARKEGADRNDRYTVIEILDDGTRIVRDNKTGRIFRANPTDERIDGVDYDFEDTEEDPFKDTTEDTTAEQLKKEGEERASKEAQAEQDTKETEERTTKEAETANKEQAEETANKEQAEAAKDTAERVAKETEATEKEAEKETKDAKAEQDQKDAEQTTKDDIAEKETKDAKAEQDQKDAEAEQVKKDKEKAAETTAKETAEGVEKEAEDDAKDAEEEKTNKDAESAKKETEATEEQTNKDREEKETKDAKAEQDQKDAKAEQDQKDAEQANKEASAEQTQKETEAEVTSKETESSEKESEKNNKEETGTKEESVAKEETGTKEESGAKEETQGKDQQEETELDFALNSKDGEEENPFVSNKDGEDANTAAGNKDGSGAGDGTGDGTGDGAGDGTGTGDGTGAGDGTGDGDGSGDGDNEGDGDGRGTGIGSGMLGGGSKPITPQSFMASISFAPELLTPYMPQNSRDYLGELLARLQQ
jgi:hypothetical protein